MTIIGVDPAFRENGFLVCIFRPIEKTIQFVKIEDIYSYDYCLRVAQNSFNDVYVAIENSNLQSAMFVPKGKFESIEAYSKRCQDVGKNKAVSQQISKQSKYLFGEERVKDYSPLKKGAKDDVAAFKRRLVKYNIKFDSRTNQDQRDAFKLATLFYDEIKLKERIKK